MTEIKKLISYSKLAGFPLSPNGDNLTVDNGSDLPYQLKRLLILHKDDILFLLNRGDKSE